MLSRVEHGKSFITSGPDCFIKGSSLIRAHTVCNVGHQSTSVDIIVDRICFKRLEKGLYSYFDAYVGFNVTPDL